MTVKKQNSVQLALGRSIRGSKAIEDLALRALLFVTPAVALIAVIVSKFFLNVTLLPITGRPSMAIFISLISGLMTLVLFLALYPSAVRATGADDYLAKAKKPALVFDAVSLGLVYTLIVVGLTIALEQIMAASFLGLKLDVYTASVLIGLACGLVSYAVIRAVAVISSKQIVNVLAFFLIAGVTVSMLTAKDTLWWEANFSTLGQATQQYTTSYYAFNITLILSALAIIVLARHLYADMEALMKQGSMLGVSKASAVKTIFIVAALGLGGVGVFQYDPNTFAAFMHVFSAGLVAIAFGALMVFLRWLLPDLSKPFMTISYVALAALVSAYILFNFIGYLSLTAFELGCFAICFGWLYLFTQQIVGSRTKATINERGES